MNRRSFGSLILKGAGALGLTSLVSVTAACPAWLSSLYQDILKYVPVGLQAFGEIVSLLNDAGIIPTPISTAANLIINAVKAGFADLQTDITNYDAAPASQKTTLLGKISTALQILEGNLQQFWSDLDIPDPALASTVESLLGIILAALGGFASALPAPVSTPALNEVLRKRATLSKTIKVPAQRMTVKEFRKSFNSKAPAQYQIR